VSVEHGPAGTADAGLLVRHLHGELDEADARDVSDHLAGCEACRTLARALEARTRRVSDALRQADFPEPDEHEWRRVLGAVRDDSATRKRPHRGLLAAGWVLAVVTTAGLASASVRGWVADRWEGVFGDGAPPTAPAADAGAPGRADLSFRPAGPELSVLLESRQAGGTLTLRFVDGSTATVSVSGGGEERLAVGDGGIRIGNMSGSRASYELTVPSHVERVLVGIGGLEPVEVARAANSGQPIAVDLVQGVVVRSPTSHDEY
jgi:hypothetical protein